MRLEELTAPWLSGILGREVGDLTVEQVGTGQIGTAFRLRFGDGDSVLVKLPPPDPAPAT